jgi:hypothetical protein
MRRRSNGGTSAVKRKQWPERDQPAKPRAARSAGAPGVRRTKPPADKLPPAPADSAARQILQAAAKHGVKVGRPSEYEPAMCDAVIAHARETGLSLTAFADAVGVDRSTLTHWAQRYPEFLTAMRRAKAARAKRLEVEVMASSNGPAISARLLALKNCAEDDWREQQDHRIGGLPGAPPVATAQIDTSKMTPEQVYAYILNGAPLPAVQPSGTAPATDDEAGDE